MQRENPASLAASDNVWIFGFRGSSFVGNRMLPLVEFFGRWEGEVRIEDENIAHSRAVTDFFARKSGWEISLGVREELTLEGNRESVEIIRLLRGKKDLPTGKTYPVDVNGDGFLAEEIRIGKGWPIGIIPGVSIGVALGFLHGERIQKADVKGILTVTGRRAYDYALDLDYAYDINYLYDLSTGHSSLDGYGYSLNVGAKYHRAGWDMSLWAEDLFSRIYWSRALYTQAIANNDRRYFDSEGYVHYDPIITGFEGKKSVTQNIHEKISLEASHTWARVRLSAASDWMRDTYFPRAALAFRRTATGGWGAMGYNVYFQMAGSQ